MEVSAGIILTYQNNILVCHPTNSSIFGTWSIPKGHVENGEELIEAAVRETFEEVGIVVKITDLNPDPILINYYRKNSNKIYKKLYAFHCPIKSLNDLNLKSEIVPYSNLQLDEIDFAAFLDVKNLEKYMFWRLKPILDTIS